LRDVVSVQFVNDVGAHNAWRDDDRSGLRSIAAPTARTAVAADVLADLTVTLRRRMVNAAAWPDGLLEPFRPTGQGQKSKWRRWPAKRP
jgi:hypothetical protein